MFINRGKKEESTPMFVPRKGYHKFDISRIAKAACQKKQASRSGGHILSA